MKKYYQALNKNDYIAAYSLLSKSEQINRILGSHPEDNLYESDWGVYVKGLETNIISAKVVRIEEQVVKPLHVPRNERINRKLSDVKIFKVDMEIKQKKLWRPDPRPRYVILPL
ncbi:MAG: DUF4829 domain-containing protein [Eubacteriales bacterium]